MGCVSLLVQAALVCQRYATNSAPYANFCVHSLYFYAFWHRRATHLANMLAAIPHLKIEQAHSRSEMLEFEQLGIETNNSSHLNRVASSTVSHQNVNNQLKPFHASSLSSLVRKSGKFFLWDGLTTVSKST